MTTTREVSNSDDVIDSRDVIARIEELEGYRDDAQTKAEERLTRIAELEALDTRTEEESGELAELYDSEIDTSEYGDDEAEELRVLTALADEAEDCADWSYGETLIRESYFEDYARQLAEDIGAISGEEKWPLTCIDWEQAARELQQDYTTVNFDNVIYLIRS